MLNRQKVLLKLMYELQKKNKASRTAIVKTLFLLKEEYGLSDKIKFYSFFPYQFGPFSQLCYADLRNFKNNRLINEDETVITKEGQKLLDTYETDFDPQIKEIASRFKTNRQMVDYIYSKYPQYTVKSSLIQTKSKQAKGISTIGYEGKDIDTFLNILIQNQINMIIDVRNNPFSMNFCFIKDKLNGYLSKAGIKYKHIPELGIESSKRQNLKTKEDYNELFKTFKETLPEQKESLNLVGELSKENRIALMCFEKEPEFCHRSVLSNELESRGYEKGVHL